MRDSLNLDLYPLDQPGSPEWRALVDRCRTDLATDGMFNLTGFMHPATAAAEVAAMQPKFAADSFRHERDHNIYFLKSVGDLPADHPALQRFQTSNDTLCADQLNGALTRLYHWPEFAGFLAATMGLSALHPMDDPLAGVNAMSYHQGQRLNWHFDRSEFTTTLLLQAPENGGEFEYRPDLRSDDDPNYDGVAKMLNGKDDQIRRLHLDPGTLNVFKGRNTAHRVTPVTGPRNRVIAVFSYFDRPGVAFSPEERIGFYGRAS